MVAFNPATDIPDLTGKVILVTGGNSGLGEASIAEYAAHNPAKIWLAARSKGKAEEAVSRIRAQGGARTTARIEIVELDLASLISVTKAARRITSESDRLDIVQLNGGVASPLPAVTSDGFEVQFGTNYLGHALLTQLLMPTLLATARRPGADVRVVAMSSVGHRVFAPSEGIHFDDLRSDMAAHKGRSGMALYGQAMLAKTLFAHALARRYGGGAHGIHATSCHPGTVQTGVWGGPKTMPTLMRWLWMPLVALTAVSPAEGAKTQLWCSVAPEAANGCYYEPIGVEKPGPLTYDDDLADRLWAWTEQQLKAHGAPGWVKV